MMRESLVSPYPTRHTSKVLRQLASMPGWSSRVWPPRLSVRSSAALATHSLTSSMLRRSMARFQPGLYWRWPSTCTFWYRFHSSSKQGQRLGDLVRFADDADQVVHRLLQVDVQRVRILRAAEPSVGPSNGLSATFAAASTASAETAGRLPSART